jgi:hypothetical protein
MTPEAKAKATRERTHARVARRDQFRPWPPAGVTRKLWEMADLVKVLEGLKFKWCATLAQSMSLFRLAPAMIANQPVLRQLRATDAG